MAGYTLIGSVSVVQVLSPKVAQETIVCTIRTEPTGIIAAMPVPQTAFEDGEATRMLSDFAGNIETLIDGGKAVGGSGTSDLDASGLTQYFVTFEVGYNPPGSPVGTITADVDVPIAYLTDASGLPTGGTGDGSGDTPEGEPLPPVQASTSPFGQAEAMIDATYQSLVALSGG